MAEQARALSVSEVQGLVLDALETAADEEDPGAALVKVRNLLADADRVTLLRVAAGLAIFGTRRQAGELTADWLARMRLEFTWRWS